MKSLIIINKGFTLIELLVVVAIIGILSTVVMVSLSSARDRAKDVAVKVDLNVIRNQAELYLSNTAGGDFGPITTVGACPTSGTSMFFTDTTIANAIAHAKSQVASGLNACMTNSPVGVNGTKWAVVSQLSTDPLQGWCVDSSGKNEQVTIDTNDQDGLNAELALGACVE